MNAITTVAAVVALLGGGLASAQASPQPLRLCADPANLPFSTKYIQVSTSPARITTSPGSRSTIRDWRSKISYCQGSDFDTSR